MRVYPPGLSFGDMLVIKNKHTHLTALRPASCCLAKSHGGLSSAAADVSSGGPRHVPSNTSNPNPEKRSAAGGFPSFLSFPIYKWRVTVQINGGPCRLSDTQSHPGSNRAPAATGETEKHRAGNRASERPSESWTQPSPAAA